MSISTAVGQGSHGFAMGDRDFKYLAGLVHSRTGIVLGDHKRDMVYGRLVRRLRALNLGSFAEYCELMESDAGQDELSNLINSITTNLTRFFREEHHFHHLEKEVLPKLIAKKQRIRLWSSACSSGMEPYSMAMVLRHLLPRQSSVDAKILATDIDSNMVSIASEGIYAQSDVKTAEERYHRYIHDLGDGRCQMDDSLKHLIAFRQLNLLESWPMRGPFDVVFCRNVIIYFDKPTKIKLFERIAGLMEPGSWLYIGHSENLHEITDRFELVGRTIYQRIA